MPTGQQATLLRSAGVISLRGAAGRLMKFGDMEKLMDDFGIPLQIGNDMTKVKVVCVCGGGRGVRSRNLGDPFIHWGYAPQ